MCMQKPWIMVNPHCYRLVAMIGRPSVGERNESWATHNHLINQYKITRTQWSANHGYVHIFWQHHISMHGTRKGQEKFATSPGIPSVPSAAHFCSLVKPLCPKQWWRCMSLHEVGDSRLLMHWDLGMEESVMEHWKAWQQAIPGANFVIVDLMLHDMKNGCNDLDRKQVCPCGIQSRHHLLGLCHHDQRVVALRGVMRMHLEHKGMSGRQQHEPIII